MLSVAGRFYLWNGVLNTLPEINLIEYQKEKLAFTTAWRSKAD